MTINIKNIPKFIINLKQNDKRLHKTLKEIEKINFDNFYTIFKAVDTKYVETHFFDYISINAYNNILNPKSTTILHNLSSVACAISHINVWKHIIENNIKHCFIIEDDLKITNHNMFKFYIKK